MVGYLRFVSHAIRQTRLSLLVMWYTNSLSLQLHADYTPHSSRSKTNLISYPLLIVTRLRFIHDTSCQNLTLCIDLSLSACKLRYIKVVFALRFSTYLISLTWSIVFVFVFVIINFVKSNMSSAYLTYMYQVLLHDHQRSKIIIEFCLFVLKCARVL
jgi:hypothetical protein